ncbi:MAG: cyclic nucleotide-binding domain-containing protein [Planctomycetota bacterium]|nr:cyclic nucleotide-binding domain-containing protein [Planctomycetota bacterium]
MGAIPVITPDSELFARVDQLMATHGLARGVEHLADAGEAIEFLRTELPDLFIIDLSDTECGAEPIVQAIHDDPWLFGGGVLGICDDDAQLACVERTRGPNYLALVPKARIEHDLPRILRIIEENRRLLFQRVMGPELVQELHGRFVMGNDPLVAHCYESMICNFLYNANRIDEDTRDALSFSMHELLMNAIEHGNCGIGFDEKSRWLEGGRPMLELIEERTQDPKIAARRVTLVYDITPERSRFCITDEGEGFDWRQARDMTSPEAIFESHGRGLLMTASVTETLTFNEQGNEVCFEVAHQEDTASATPALLAGLPARRVEPGDVIFRQGEPGDALYFITRGRYEVIADGKHIADLGPDDLLIGEMSFLLRSTRNATVTASRAGALVAISKARFVEAIRQRPYYALLLARLMAERLQRLLSGEGLFKRDR